MQRCLSRRPSKSARRQTRDWHLARLCPACLALPTLAVSPLPAWLLALLIKVRCLALLPAISKGSLLQRLRTFVFIGLRASDTSPHVAAHGVVRIPSVRAQANYDGAWRFRQSKGSLQRSIRPSGLVGPMGRRKVLKRMGFQAKGRAGRKTPRIPRTASSFGWGL